MKIVSLIAENVKKLVAVEITPDGNMVQITGKNGQGKTSVLDSIWWALAGATHIQAVPIRKGANKAIIKLDLGEIKVIRTFSRKEESGATTSIIVENSDGARFPSPQKMLDSLLGELSFDPLAFARMEPKAQFDALRKFVPDVDFDAIDNANQEDFQRRRDINRQSKEAKAAAGAIIVPIDTRDQETDEAALVAELEQAGKHNSEIETRKANRERVAMQIASSMQSIETDKARCDELLREIQLIRERALTLQAKADELQEKLDGAEPLPKAIDTSALLSRIELARAQNGNVRKLADRKQHEQRAVALETQSKEITERMEKRQVDKQAAIAAAKMPVQGIEFGDGEVLLNGVPFNQGSDAEQLRSSVAIAMAMNPTLRVIRIRDGSLLDDDAMKILAEAADANDMQVWIERVDSSGKIGFVLEDGRLKSETQEKAA